MRGGVAVKPITPEWRGCSKSSLYVGAVRIGYVEKCSYGWRAEVPTSIFSPWFFRTKNQAKTWVENRLYGMVP